MEATNGPSPAVTATNSYRCTQLEGWQSHLTLERAVALAAAAAAAEDLEASRGLLG